jgi:hypothetical protein
MRETTKTRTLAAALAAAAIAAPSAAAMPIEPTSTGAANPAAAPPPVTRTVEVQASGFDWGDAGIGAAAMLSVLGLGTGVVVAGRRGRSAQPRIG